ncbi:hypothetical protein ACG873_31490 [Mesorhizobium sp. AaZ16]|uniref:hypothetical protein n=1 Tax=Mesorhizobium sp. AaZ16 TaxID=3402289 RepID=UPI00374ECCCC
MGHLKLQPCGDAVLLMLSISLGPLNPEERKTIAYAALACWSNFDRRISPVSPSEKEWFSRDWTTGAQDD